MTFASQLWVTPALDGAETGGTIYNRSLLGALRGLGVPCDACDLERLRLASIPPAPDVAWLDSLYLAHAHDVRSRLSPRTRLGLVMHYLPSQLCADAAERERLIASERAAVTLASLCIAPSTTLARWLHDLVPEARVVCIEPGVEEGLSQQATASAHAASALMIANLVPNKGVLALLEALAPCVREDDGFTLTIVGYDDHDRAYARACRELVERSPALRDRVTFTGGLPHAATLYRLAQSSLLVSASRSESYGLALAEARALGVPILARTGGHVADHVSAATGGELVSDAAALAAACLRLLRAPAELATRRAAARRSRPARTWPQAAQELLASL